MIHYHGTPITPLAAFEELAGCFFFVSFAHPSPVEMAHVLGQGVGLDNGGFTAWTKGIIVDWVKYYAWCDKWLAAPTTWAVIPDVIGAGAEAQDALLLQWPHGHRGAPVWHMDEPIERLLWLCDNWPKVCIGSCSEYAVVLSEPWRRRMNEAWDAIARRHSRLPWIHMLRGMQLSGRDWPFGSVDSTDVARNHNRGGRTPRERAHRWDAMQCPSAWQGPDLLGQRKPFLWKRASRAKPAA